MPVNALHQQRPAGAADRRQAAGCKRAAFHAPAVLVFDNQPRLHAVLCSQLDQLGAAEQRLEARDGSAYQQRLFLPVAAHELSRAQAPEQRHYLMNIHGTIV